jgi:hypothetical protein
VKIPTFQVAFRTFKQKISVIFVDCNSLRKQGVCLYKRHFCFAKCLLGIPKPFVICIVPLQAARSCRTLFDGVHDSVIYSLGTAPLKRKSADNDFVSTHCNLFTSL